MQQFRTTCRFPLVWALLFLVSAAAFAESGVYQSRAAFLREALGSPEPTSAVIWMQKEMQATAKEILGHPYDGLRVRYWYEGDRSAWILDEIGKEKPITMGIVVDNGEVTMLRVLQFRESRGWEIRYPFFTRQFSGLTLTEKGALNKSIDGITGATLSVRAAARSANLALYLDEQRKQRLSAR